MYHFEGFKVMEIGARGTSGVLDIEVLNGLSSDSVRERSVKGLNTSSWALLPQRRSPPQGRVILRPFEKEVVGAFLPRYRAGPRL